MKILLVRPKPHHETIGLQSIMVCEPLELEYLAAMVNGAHQVDVVDMILEKKPLLHYLKKYNPQVVAVTAYIAHVNVVNEYARIIKGFNPAIRTIVGGVHAEVVPDDFLDTNIDFIISANPMNSFQSLLTVIDEGNDEPLKGIFPKQRNVPPQAEEVIPPVFPDRTVTARYRQRYYYVFHNPCALLKTSYGCPYVCNFCFCRNITGGAYYERDLEGIIEEIKEIPEPEIYIVDDNFLVNPRRVEEFCNLLESHGICKRFLIYGRADFITEHEELIGRFARLGLRAVIVGVESPNPQELEKYHKKSSVSVNERAIQILARYGVDCYATLILGADWTREDFDNLGNWLKKQQLRFINLQPFTPLPGTALFDEYQDRLIIPRSQYQQWDLANLVIKPEKMSVRRYYFNIIKLYFSISLRLDSLRKNLRYGIVPNVKLSLGVARITWQYLKKCLRGA